MDRVLAKEVVAKSRELHGGTSLEKINLEVIRDVKEGSGVFHSLFSDFSKGLASVGHLHDGHTGAIPVKELFLGLLKNRLGQDAGTSTKIPYLLTKGLFRPLD